MTSRGSDAGRIGPARFNGREGAFAGAVFLSAALVFMVEPMVAKLVLPLLGGTPAVWNTCLAFFQIALLVGYLYAHLLQRLPAIKLQAYVHLGVLIAAALFLPLRISGLWGEPDSARPILWLLGTLTASLGAPFAALSATAPLVQAWRARMLDPTDPREPYALYAASNLGSLLALLAYPIAVEPLLTLTAQRLAWSGAYAIFVAAMAALAALWVGGRSRAPAGPAQTAAPIRWGQRLAWLALAAAPSSLMLGTTTYLTTDVASAPFLWVLPLALYLVTFIIAFQSRPLISRKLALLLGAAALSICAYQLAYRANPVLLQLAIHLSAFFFSALICHQSLVERRPPASQLTEFYLWMSIGGVVGGAFNAFVAPGVFNVVFEYPLVLVLAVFARPFGPLKMSRRDGLLLATGVGGVVAAILLNQWLATLPALSGLAAHKSDILLALLAVTVLAAFMLRRHIVAFPLLLLLLLGTTAIVGQEGFRTVDTFRSFFGVAKITSADIPGLGDKVMILAHGTTLHGAQAPAGPFGCKPLLYYAEETPIGQVFVTTKAARPAINVGAVGLGAGTVSTYVRKTDQMTFFEIDPLIISIANTPKYFAYTTECAKAPPRFVVGDARLSMAKQPDDSFDILLIDAFSSDAVPAHLLTVEALKMYLRKIKPDGVVILHLSNRNLDLMAPAQAGALAAGGYSLYQRHTADPSLPLLWESSEDAVILARNQAALAPYLADARWSRSTSRVRPWTDNYMNLVGAFAARIGERLKGRD